MTVALQFVGGDEIVEPFLLHGSQGTIIDLSGLALSGGVWWQRRERISLAVGAGLGVEVVTPLPATTAGDVPQDPHGYIRITEAQSALIPLGQIASLRLKAVNADGVTMSSFFAPLERIS